MHHAVAADATVGGARGPPDVACGAVLLEAILALPHPLAKRVLQILSLRLQPLLLHRVHCIQPCDFWICGTTSRVITHAGTTQLPTSLQMLARHNFPRHYICPHDTTSRVILLSISVRKSHNDHLTLRYSPLRPSLKTRRPNDTNVSSHFWICGVQPHDTTSTSVCTSSLGQTSQLTRWVISRSACFLM